MVKKAKKAVGMKKRTTKAATKKTKKRTQKRTQNAPARKAGKGLTGIIESLKAWARSMGAAKKMNTQSHQAAKPKMPAANAAIANPAAAPSAAPAAGGEKDASF